VILDEPVRGRTPPPWIHALAGIERVRAFSRGLLPSPPLARPLGLRTTHVAAGTATVVMPASEASVSGNGQLEISPLMMTALRNASLTALPPAVDATPLTFTTNPLRPAWPRSGNILARARVVNSGNLFVLAEVQVEDPDGRYLAQGSLQSAIRRVEPAPPRPPETMQPVEEPVYETPDPHLRRFSTTPVRDLFEQGDSTALTRAVHEGSVPFTSLFGICYEDMTEGRAIASMPASEWFCVHESDVSTNAISALANVVGWGAAVLLLKPGRSLAALGGTVRFLRPVRPDGRGLRAESLSTEPAPDLFVGNVTIRDADGQLVALQTGAVVRLDNAQRMRRPRRQSRRVLATLLFTNIVDSTGHAKRLGDSRWQTLLDEHRLAVRREVSRYNGIEVDTAGDGFFARFDAPAQAIGAACAARQTTTSLGLEVRTGIHTGECELQGSKLAGMTVHIAARIQAAAQPGEILVSSTVKDLAVGSSLRFADRGEQNLKGVPDAWRLYAVVD